MSQRSKVLSLFGDAKPRPNEHLNYSDLLNDFVQPYEPRFPKDYIWEDVLQFGANAWNLATMEQFLPPGEHRSETYRNMSEPEKTIMKQMIRKKADTYGKYNRFIVDFTLDESPNGQDKLNVVTQEKEKFFDDIMSEMDELGFDDEEDQEGYIDRIALTLTRKQPFYDWLNTVDSKKRVEDAAYKETKIYLLDEDIEENAEAWLRQEFHSFFEMELMASVHYEADWPTKRTYKKFREWFDFSFSSMVYDMENYPIYKQGII